MRPALILVVILGLGPVVGAVVVGTRLYENTVVENPYETGLRWDELRKKRERLGWEVELDRGRYRPGENRIRFRIRDRGGIPLTQAKVSLRIERRETAVYNRDFAIRGSGSELESSVSFPRYGHWVLRFRVEKNGEFLELLKEIYVAREENRK